MFEGFAKLRSTLTGLVFLRRIAHELQRANDIAEARLALDHPAWYKSSEFKAVKRSPKLAEIDLPTVDDWNKNYERTHPQAEEEDQFT